MGKFDNRVEAIWFDLSLSSWSSYLIQRQLQLKQQICKFSYRWIKIQNLMNLNKHSYTKLPFQWNPTRHESHMDHIYKTQIWDFSYSHNMPVLFFIKGTRHWHINFKKEKNFWLWSSKLLNFGVIETIHITCHIKRTRRS